VKLCFPLYARILLWFFLNLVLLAAAFVVLLRIQFHSGFDWLLAAGAGQRIQAVCDVIVADLGDRPLEEWSSVLARFNEAYQLRFFLFHNNDGVEIAGDPIQLPPAVRARLPGQRGPVPRPGLPGNLPGRLPFEDRADRPLPAPALPPGENPKSVVRTLDPTRYWALVRVAVRAPAMPRPLPATLVVLSNTLSAGGLFFDFKPWLAVGFGAVVFSGLLWFPLARSITRSIGQMTEATRQIAEGSFDGRVDERRRDELGSLGQSINRMAARLAGFVAGQKRFLGDIAHELCAPIARTQVALGILEQRADDKSKAYVEDLREEVQHMSSLVNELLSFSKASLGANTIQLKPVLLRGLVEQVIRREGADTAQIRLDIAADVSALAEPELLVRALANLLRNAVRYAGQAGPITVSAHREDENVLLTVADNGPGVPEPELARIFDPFYRLDASREATTGGVGLGLAIVKTCVESCRGSVSCRNRQPSGLEVTLSLPAPDSQLVSREQPPHAIPA
jgi:two-component system, OmpR family, sensor histidine kinase CpxA